MKTGKPFFAALMILVLFSLTSFAQPKSISKEVYDAAIKESQSNTDKRMRKETTIEKRYAGGSLSETVTINQEFAPPDKSKWVVTSTKGNSTETTEIIYIGDFEYRKTNGSEWAKRNLKSGNNGGFGISGTDSGTREYSLEEIKTGKETFQVFTILTTYPSGSNIDYKTWIKDKLIYKTTSVMSFYKKEYIGSESVTTYDYSAKKIKISAPNIKPKGKAVEK